MKLKPEEKAVRFVKKYSWMGEKGGLRRKRQQANKYIYMATVKIPSV